MHFLIQVPALVYYHARWYPTFGFANPTFWRVILLMLPRIVGLGILSYNFALINNRASFLGEGAVSAFSWGWQLTQIPQTLLGTSLSIVIFPTLVVLSSSGNAEDKHKAISDMLRFILVTTIPCAVGLILVGQPLISLLEGGAFDQSATAMVYGSLRYLTLTVVALSTLEIVSRAFYADQDTTTPLWGAVGGAILTTILAFTLSGTSNFTLVNLEVNGLAIALSCGLTFEVLILLFILHHRWQWHLLARPRTNAN